MKYLKLVLKNLLRRKRSTILTILSIAVVLFIFSVLVSLPTFANQMLADTTSSVRIITRTKMGLAYPLPVAYKPKIAGIPHLVCRLLLEKKKGRQPKRRPYHTNYR